MSTVIDIAVSGRGFAHLDSNISHILLIALHKTLLLPTIARKIFNIVVRFVFLKSGTILARIH